MGELNQEQYRASRPDRGISLVLAGAGTGKTRTLVEKVGNVIRGLPLDPAQVLVLTFSRKAAEELRARIAVRIGGAKIHASTFHAFCLDLVIGHWERFDGARRFAGPPSVIDEETRLRIIRELVFPDLARFLGVPGDVVVRLLGGPRRPDPGKQKKLESSGLAAELAALAKRYEEKKRELNAIDYDDMVGLAIGLLEEDRSVRAAVLDRYRYVFVDEFQDVSDDNVRLLGLILPDRGSNLFAVGDDWQSIYGFRNARVEYIVRMKRYFPGADVRRLTVNYRSRREIVSLSGRFIRRNRFRTRKGLTAQRGRGRQGGTPGRPRHRGGGCGHQSDRRGEEGRRDSRGAVPQQLAVPIPPGAARARGGRGRRVRHDHARVKGARVRLGGGCGDQRRRHPGPGERHRGGAPSPLRRLHPGARGARHHRPCQRAGWSGTVRPGAGRGREKKLTMHTECDTL